MAYATTQDIQARMTRTLTTDEQAVCAVLLEDAAVIIDTYNADAGADAKKVVSCRMVQRAIETADLTIPMGASQGSQAGLGFSESWTVSTGGAVGELYIGKLEKQMLGAGDIIASHSPIERSTNENNDSGAGN